MDQPRLWQDVQARRMPESCYEAPPLDIDTRKRRCASHSFHAQWTCMKEPARCYCPPVKRGMRPRRVLVECNHCSRIGRERPWSASPDLDIKSWTALVLNVVTLHSSSNTPHLHQSFVSQSFVISLHPQFATILPFSKEFISAFLRTGSRRSRQSWRLFPLSG